MGLGKLVAISLFGTSLLFAAEYPDRPLAPPNYKPCLRLAAVLAFGTISGAAATAYGFDEVHNLRAKAMGKKHVGHGIYLDLQEVLSTLSQYERRVVENRRNDALSVIELFTDKLWGDYDNSKYWSLLTFHSENATDYLSHSARSDRGVCRHKSAILAGILNELGIHCHLELGTSTKDEWHVWVKFDDYPLVADPTTNEVLHSDAYLRRQQGWVIPFSWVPKPFY